MSILFEKTTFALDDWRFLEWGKLPVCARLPHLPLPLWGSDIESAATDIGCIEFVVHFWKLGCSAVKEDILEQLVDDYLQSRGYFTRHNLKFRPRRDHPQFDKQQDSNHSDIDVVGLHPARKGVDRVWVVSCKSWQSGFDVSAKLDEIQNNKIRSGRESWRFFRELVEPKWAEAFRAAVRDATGQSKFTYVTAVTKVKGSASAWENHPEFLENTDGNPIRMISLQEMMNELLKNMTTTIVPSQLGRTVQLLRAAGAKLEWPQS